MTHPERRDEPRSTTPRTHPARVPLGVGLVVAALLVVLGGCGDTVSNAVNDVVSEAASAPACAAVSGVQEQLAGIDVSQIPPDQLSQLQTGAGFVSTAVGALSDQLPAGVSDDLDSAQQRLDTAIEGAEGNAAERQAAIEDAIAGYSSQLDDVAQRLGC